MCNSQSLSIVPIFLITSLQELWGCLFPFMWGRLMLWESPMTSPRSGRDCWAADGPDSHSTTSFWVKVLEERSWHRNASSCSVLLPNQVCFQICKISYLVVNGLSLVFYYLIRGVGPFFRVAFNKVVDNCWSSIVFENLSWWLLKCTVCLLKKFWKMKKHIHHVCFI